MCETSLGQRGSVNLARSGSHIFTGLKKLSGVEGGTWPDLQLGGTTTSLHLVCIQNPGRAGKNRLLVKVLLEYREAKKKKKKTGWRSASS